MIILITKIDDRQIILSDSNNEVLQFEDEGDAIDFIKQNNTDNVNPKLQNIPLSSYRLSNLCSKIPRLPDFIASKYEEECGNYMIIDSQSGEVLSNNYRIMFADSNCGFFVACYGDSNIETENEYILHINKNLVIIKDSNTVDIYE